MRNKKEIEMGKKVAQLSWKELEEIIRDVVRQELSKIYGLFPDLDKKQSVDETQDPEKDAIQKRYKEKDLQNKEQNRRDKQADLDRLKLKR